MENMVDHKVHGLKNLKIKPWLNKIISFHQLLSRNPRLKRSVAVI